MLFSSLTFLYAFLPLVLLLYYVLPDQRWRNTVLLVSSLLFYAWGDLRSVPLLLAATLAVWVCGLGMAGERPPGLRHFCFIFSLLLLIGTLFLFKYLNFFVSSVSNLTGHSFSLRHIALPAAISFYTFQLLSYVIDLRRGDISHEKNIFRFLLYICFFPQLLQGPIVRFGEIRSELSIRHTSWNEVLSGSRRFILGLAKKVLLADSLAIIANSIYAAPSFAGTAALWLAGLCYTLQSFFDFSGYSDMAVGLGLFFGFHLPENFRYPYAALSVSDFWRRWHMTLTRWFRDYVYIPLGGNRVSRPRYLLNILSVWALTGLWHGASWNFVLWGLYNGILLLVERFILKNQEQWPRILRNSLTFALVLIGWVIFSHQDFSVLTRVLRNMFVFQPTAWKELLILDASVISKLPALPPALLFSFPLAEKLRFREDNLLSAFLINGFYLGLLAVCIMFLIGASFHPFIYFNF